MGVSGIKINAVKKYVKKCFKSRNRQTITIRCTLTCSLVFGRQSSFFKNIYYLADLGKKFEI